MDEQLYIYIIKNISHIYLNIDFDYLSFGGTLYRIYSKVSYIALKWP